MPCRCGQHRTEAGCAGARVLAALPAEVKRRKPMGKPPATRRRGPNCACGCGKRCFVGCTYASKACVPHERHVAIAVTSRQQSAIRQRLARYKAVLDRLEGRRFTREDLVAILDDEFKRGYQACLARERRSAA